jgi:glycerol-3-phosphate dehydrogenase
MSIIENEFSYNKRLENIKKLREDIFDILIIGGGITGAGISCLSQYVGIKTALVEMNDFASGTSSKSSKLLHGGLRYLEKFKIKLVFEALRDRNNLFEILPHISKPIPFIAPVYDFYKQSLFFINSGVTLYDLLSLISKNTLNSFHRIIKKDEFDKFEPNLRKKDLNGGIKYYDGYCDDARLTIENIKTSNSLGATICNYLKVIGFKKENNKVNKATVFDIITGQVFDINAKVIINAGGPWVDSINKYSNSSYKNRLKPTKGIHIIVPKLTNDNAVFLKTVQEPMRWIFIIPYGEYSIIGTTDTEAKVNEDDYSYLDYDNYAKEEEIDYLLNTVNFYYPESNLSKDDIVSSYGGWRPLIAPPKNKKLSESDISREDEIFETDDGIVCIAGGKLTTYISMAKKVVNYLIKNKNLKVNKELSFPKLLCWNTNLSLKEFVNSQKILLSDKYDKDLIEYLINKYGTEFYKILSIISIAPNMKEDIKNLSKDARFLRAEIIYSVLYEMCITLKDLMIRRNRILLKDKYQGIYAIDEISEVMSFSLSSILNWDEETRKEWLKKQKDEYIKEVELTNYGKKSIKK